MSRRYSERTCLECGETIRESAYSGSRGNFSKHVAAHEAAKSKMVQQNVTLRDPAGLRSVPSGTTPQLLKLDQRAQSEKEIKQCR